MLKLKFIYSFFILAALLFVAKPFLGFEVQESLLTSSQESSIIIKAFSKRKPEYIVEAQVNKSAISFRLNHPPTSLLTSILSFIVLLFPFLNVLKAIRHWHSNSFYTSSPIYLLAGQLII